MSFWNDKVVNLSSGNNHPKCFYTLQSFEVPEAKMDRTEERNGKPIA